MKRLAMRVRWGVFVATTTMIVALSAAMDGSGPATKKLLFAQPPAEAVAVTIIDSAAQEATVAEFLVLPRVGAWGRSPLYVDHFEALMIDQPDFRPQLGALLTLPNNQQAAWEVARTNAEGWLDHPHLRGGLAFATIRSNRARIMILETAAHRMAIFNGEPRGGDVYANDFVHLPVKLEVGDNTLVIQGLRGRVRARLVEPKATAQFLGRDDTTPDLIVAETGEAVAAVVVVNATETFAQNLMIAATASNGTPTITRLPSIPPLGARKVPVRLAGPVPTEPGEREYTLQLLEDSVADAGIFALLDSRTLKLGVRRPTQTHKRTFISDIDQSVQYYGINPANPLPEDTSRPAMVLSLHGASVEAIGQANAYSSKTWAHLVAPTNRRPFGFDWEDWGRWDAIEVLDHAQAQLATDPRRVYLTGHSMGGHGTWHVGVTFPDRFAAIGPSAGWISMWSYAGAQNPGSPTTFETLLRRAVGASDTLALSENYSHLGVYILHGDADDNVPASEARTMVQKLGEFHRDFRYHFQPGAGHWWDSDDEPGAACVDWAPMFDFFARRRLPEREAVREVTFTTASPGVNGRCHWVTIAQQIRIMQPSRVELRFDPHKRRFAGTTTNVARLAFDVSHLPPKAPITVVLDGETLADIEWPSAADSPTTETATGPTIWVQRTGENWVVMPFAPSTAEKGPHRYGPFKNAFRQRMIYVIGTKGSEAENRWALAKARFDAETFWYRGNGVIDIVRDVDFDATADPDGNVILLGNAQTNAAWATLLSTSPIQVHSTRITLGNREFHGDNLAAVFVRPRPNSSTALVAAIAGTGLSGMKLTTQFPYFVSGVGYPDVFIADTSMLRHGDAGLRATGFFANDWSLNHAEFVIRD